MNTITEKIAEQIGSSGPQITERVINHLVEREVAKRSEAIIKAFDSLDRLEREGRKIKPDLVAYGDDGKVTTQSWSKNKLDERNSHNAKVQKLQAAINKALDKNDYSDLFNLINGKPDQPAAD